MVIPIRLTVITHRLQSLMELGIITLLATLFLCLSVRDAASYTPDGLETARLTAALFDPNFRQSGLEHERLSGVLLPVKIGLTRYAHIPTWNPYMGGGEPIINNAFSYLFNPFYSLPVLLADSFAQGTKIATFIALLIAGYNTWALAYAFGIGAVGRVAAGALYLMNGSIAGKFSAGHFQLALSLAWPPLVLAALWWTLRSKNRLAPVAFGVAFALLFFAGNIYYMLHTLICAGIIILFHIVERRTPAQPTDSQHSTLRTRRFVVRWDQLRRVGVAGAFAFGLAGAQFFPVWLTRDYVDHDVQKFNADGTLEGHYDFAQASAFFTSPSEALRTMPGVIYEQAVAVDYAYVGSMVFLLIAGGGVIALVRPPMVIGDDPRWRVIGIALVLALGMMIWGTGESGILPFLYARIGLLAEFRFLGRAQAMAVLWWVVLAGIAIDLLWKAARDLLKTPAAYDRPERARLIRGAGIGFMAWVYMAIYSSSNTSTRLGLVFNNVQLLNTLDERRFASFTGAALALWVFVLAAVVIDSLLMVMWQIMRTRLTSPSVQSQTWRRIGTRALRIGLLSLVFYALHDVMTVNSRLYQVDVPTTRFALAFPDIREADGDPFPAVNLPFSPGAFEVYEAELRNWGLNEGWIPNSVDGLLSWEAGTLYNLPRWAIVSNAYGGASQAYAQQVVDEFEFQLVKCYALENAPSDPCKLEGGMAAVLYGRADVLPYTFIVPEEALLTLPGELRANNVYPAAVIAHRQDRITIQAATPPVAGDYYLVVQEANFPGWQAEADGIRLETKTAQTYRDPLTGDRGFIAVLMPERAHTYTFWFEPPGFGLGVVVSLMTLAVMGWCVLRRKL